MSNTSDATDELTNPAAPESEDVIDPSTPYMVAAQELNGLVRQLESGSMSVDEVVSAVARAASLVEFCRTKVLTAQAQVKDITARVQPPSA